MAFRPVTNGHIDQPLTDFSLEVKDPEYIAEVLFPVKNVKKSSDKYFKYGNEVFEIQDTELTPRSVARDFEYTITTQNYSLGLHGLGGFVPQEQIENADKPLDAEKDMVRFLTRAILRVREYICAQIATDENNYAPGYAETLSGNDKWDAYTTSNPIDKVEAIKEKIRQGCGSEPNVMVVSASVHRKLKSHPVIKDVVKYTRFGVPTLEDMARAFEVDKYIVAKSIYKSGSNVYDIWGKNVILARVEEPSVLSNTFGVLFQKSDARKTIVEEYLHPAGKRIIVEDKFVPSIVMNTAGYLLKGVVS